MPAFERKLHRHAEGITILRTMEVTAQPPCRRFLESGNELRRTETVKPVGRLVLHEPPRQHLWIVLARGNGVGRHAALDGRSRGQTRAQQARLVHHFAFRAKLDWSIRIAFARRKGITEGNNEDILDRHLRLRAFPSIRQSDRHGHARTGPIECIGPSRHLELTLPADPLLSALPPPLPRLPLP